MSASAATRRLHRLAGLVLLLPLAGWVATGFIFFLKPGYAQAYDALTPRTYPLAGAPSVTPQPEWLEVRSLRTILGDHLLVRTADGWQQRDPSTGAPRAAPDDDAVRRLLTDAFAGNPSRYGEVARLSGLTATTTTGVEVVLDWNRMSLRQRGADTDRIDWLYRIHYLQWTGIPGVDRVLGAVGLVLLLVLSLLGARLAFARGGGARGVLR